MGVGEWIPRGVGAFLIQRIILQTLDFYKVFFGRFPKKKLQYNFPKMIGGVEDRLEFF